MTEHPKQDFILDANGEPFPDFRSASFMRDQLNKATPDYSFIVSEHPDGGFVVKVSKKHSSTSSSNASSSQYAPSGFGPASYNNDHDSHTSNRAGNTSQYSNRQQDPLSKISRDAREFMSKTPIVLRPAWRNFYFRLPFTLFGFAIAFMAKFALEAYLPRDLLQWLYSKMPYFPSLLFWFIIAISIYHLALMAFHIYSNTYTITREGVKGREGIISRDARTIKFKDIRSVALEQSIFDRLLGVGTIEFYTAGYEGADVIFDNIANPVLIKDYLEEYSNAYN